MTANQVLESIQAAGLDARSYISAAGTVIQVRIGETEESVCSLLPLDESSHQRFISFLISSARECESDPRKYEKLREVTKAWSELPPKRLV